MCHADQELNRSLTETAVRFASRIHADGGQSEGETEAETVWVGDTYFLVPRRLVDESAVVFDVDGGSLQTVMRCATCRSTLGEISSPATGTSTVKLSKYMLEPCSLPQHTWMSTLLATLQHAAASHGSRRFLVQPTPCSAPGIEVWLFSRALFTTSLARHWSIAGHQTGKVWKGHRLFFRTPSAEGDAAETIELPQPVYGWLVDAMRQCNASLPRELASVLPTWSTAYLATPVGEEQS
ncbi:conserved hypothetical protein [Sporisorium reilianum SRZ2]|uniref:Uncharacterized protein n=1 Tax=Sporisorium reilianum (strain SRZ2) TaxID=999809 RepID=E6ZNT7_SPORE|nr:conserved hypothetical protein [Sporisorium reilianum SRZ2]